MKTMVGEGEEGRRRPPVAGWAWGRVEEWALPTQVKASWAHATSKTEGPRH